MGRLSFPTSSPMSNVARKCNPFKILDVWVRYLAICATNPRVPKICTFPNGIIPAMNADDNSFPFIVPLKHLVGIWNNYIRLTCGRQTTSLIRARNDNDYLSVSAADTKTQVINSIKLRVVHVFSNDDIKLRLFQTVKKDAPIVVPVTKWELHK